jgi:hypothetical protein
MSSPEETEQQRIVERMRINEVIARRPRKTAEMFLRTARRYTDAIEQGYLLGRILSGTGVASMVSGVSLLIHTYPNDGLEAMIGNIVAATGSIAVVTGEAIRNSYRKRQRRFQQEIIEYYYK